MNIGALYEIKKYSWLFYPTKEIAADAATDRCWPGAPAYWSSRLNCKVSFIPENSMFVLLEQDGKYCKVLSTNGELGWIFYPENEHWAKGWIEEVKQ